MPQLWTSKNKQLRKPKQNHGYDDLWAKKKPKEMVSGLKTSKRWQERRAGEISFSKIWWTPNVLLIMIENWAETNPDFVESES